MARIQTGIVGATRDALGRFVSNEWNSSTDTSEWTTNVVSSSNVSTVGYNAGTNTLEVIFHSGAVYHYFGVDEDVYESFLAAASKGKFVHYVLKGAYAYERVA